MLSNAGHPWNIAASSYSHCALVLGLQEFKICLSGEIAQAFGFDSPLIQSLFQHGSPALPLPRPQVEMPAELSSAEDPAGITDPTRCRSMADRSSVPAIGSTPTLPMNDTCRPTLFSRGLLRRISEGAISSMSPVGSSSDASITRRTRA